jgi:hypothetical protein
MGYDAGLEAHGKAVCAVLVWCTRRQGVGGVACATHGSDGVGLGRGNPVRTEFPLDCVSNTMLAFCSLK